MSQNCCVVCLVNERPQGSPLYCSKRCKYAAYRARNLEEVRARVREAERRRRRDGNRGETAEETRKRKQASLERRRKNYTTHDSLDSDARAKQRAVNLAKPVTTSLDVLTAALERAKRTESEKDFEETA